MDCSRPVLNQCSQSTSFVFSYFPLGPLDAKMRYAVAWTLIKGGSWPIIIRPCHSVKLSRLVQKACGECQGVHY